MNNIYLNPHSTLTSPNSNQKSRGPSQACPIYIYIKRYEVLFEMQHKNINFFCFRETMEYILKKTKSNKEGKMRGLFILEYESAKIDAFDRKFRILVSVGKVLQGNYNTGFSINILNFHGFVNILLCGRCKI